MSNPPTFSMGNWTLPYCKSLDQNANENELSIEVPIAFNLLNQIVNKNNIIELGSTIPYFHHKWIEAAVTKNPKAFPYKCIDPSSTRAGIDTRDPLVLDTNPTWDLVFSLSKFARVLKTSEPIRQDIMSKKKRWLTLLNKCLSWLSPSGTLMISIPYGKLEMWGGWEEETELLRDLEQGTWNGRYPKPTTIYKMNRTGMGMAGNIWVEKSIEDHSLPYYTDIPCAGTMYFLLWDKAKLS